MAEAAFTATELVATIVTVLVISTGGKVAADMLQETEAKLLDILNAIGEGE
jgi:hypothetical protein